MAFGNRDSYFEQFKNANFIETRNDLYNMDQNEFENLLQILNNQFDDSVVDEIEDIEELDSTIGGSIPNLSISERLERINKQNKASPFSLNEIYKQSKPFIESFLEQFNSIAKPNFGYVTE